MKQILALIFLIAISSSGYSQTECVTDGGYAGAQIWFINNETIQFQKWNYAKYGLPRVLQPNDVTKTGAFKNVGVYIETGLKKGRAEVIYIPSRQGCEFQPYQLYCGTAELEKEETKTGAIVIKATLKDIKGAMSYMWSSDDVKIIKGQGTPKITVDLKNLKDGSIYSVYLTINKGKACPVTAMNSFGVGK
jgi:hypothetical protein